MATLTEIIGEEKRRLNDVLKTTTDEIKTTESAITDLKRLPAAIDDVADLIIRRCQAVAAAGAGRILELKDHDDLAGVNSEQHFTGALTQLLFFLFQEQLTAIVGERVRRIWPDGISSAERTTGVRQLEGKLAKLTQAKQSIESELRSVGVRPRVLVER
ncbi:MAG: hypothetical protein Q8S00_08665 [Deltaproteobacteria bacterium]|nr:hypothetical protein [Deltaproteobacteria bacterium]